MGLKNSQNHHSCSYKRVR